MKTRPTPSTRAFTLIELITVIAIISILMALLFPHLASVRNNARQQLASTVLKTALNACHNYKNDYGKYPPIAAAEDSNLHAWTYGDQVEGKCKADNGLLFDVLRGIDRSGGPNENFALNLRHQKYFEDKKAVDPRNPREGFLDGSEFAREKNGQLMDPWGAPYCLILENDGDEQIDMSAFYADLSGPENAVRNSAAGFSLGRDGKRGGPGYEGRSHREGGNEAPDDVFSWR